MRKGLLQVLNVLFAKYVSIILALWLAWMLTDLFMGLLVFPATREGMWYIGLGGTLGCLIGAIIIGASKALFHKKVVQALEALGGANA